jgi:hypothetical protein
MRALLKEKYMDKKSFYSTATVIETGEIVGVEWNSYGCFFKCSDGVLRQEQELTRFVF